MSRFVRPLIALVLAIVPFFLFIGTTNTVTVNGELVSDQRFNLAGLVMAIIGLWLVFGVLRPSAPRDGARKALAVLAGLLCVVQLAAAVGAVRVDPLDWLMPDRHLPELRYSGLQEKDAIYLTVKSPEAYRSALASSKGDILAQARQHRAYADRCHGGRYRVDLARAERVPEYLDAQASAELQRRAARPSAAGQAECSPARSNRVMGKEVDSLNRHMDLFDRLEAEYLASIK